MPWKDKSVKGTREDFVKECLSEDANISEISRRYGVSRTCAYKWIERYEAGAVLEDQSRRPMRMPNRVAESMEKLIVVERVMHPTWGPKKLKRRLEDKGYRELPALSTFENILKRNGMVTKEASLAARPCKGFVRSEPNELWQTDFKGDFLLRNNVRCYPLTCTDDYSRMNLCLSAQRQTTTQVVQEQFMRMFEEYGLPQEILCDNGNPWGTSQSTGITRLEVWWMQHGILPIHGRIKHPQTQGKEERFHKSLKLDLLSQGIPYDLEDAQKRFDEYRVEYNTIRPHEALNLDVPAAHYKPSPRKLQRVKEWEYDTRYEQRIIKESGYITYRGQGYFLSEGLGGVTVGIRESYTDGCVTICYREFAVARINVNERCLVSRKIRYDREQTTRTDGRNRV